MELLCVVDGCKKLARLNDMCRSCFLSNVKNSHASIMENQPLSAARRRKEKASNYQQSQSASIQLKETRKRQKLENLLLKNDLPLKPEPASFQEMYPIKEDLLSLLIISAIERYGSLEEQRLKNRIVNALFRAGFNTISDLHCLNAKELSKTRNLGTNCQDVIRNLFIRMSVNPVVTK